MQLCAFAMEFVRKWAEGFRAIDGTGLMWMGVGGDGGRMSSSVMQVHTTKVNDRYNIN